MQRVQERREESGSVTVACILGSGHCGSTLLDMVLGSHSTVESLGQCEKVGIKDTCGCGERVAECPLWGEVGAVSSFRRKRVEGIYRPKWHFVRNTDAFWVRCLQSSEQMERTEYQECTSDVYHACRERTGCTILVDSSKNPDRVAVVNREEAVRPVLIHIVRDGRAVSWSYIKRYRKKGFSPLLLMWRWVSANIKVELLRHQTRAPYLFVRYEQLVAAPETTAQQICRELSIPYEPTMLNFAEHTHHLIGGNAMQFTDSSEIRADEQWKQDMPFRYRVMFNIMFGWLNLYYMHIKTSYGTRE